jgi:hypothetical protein
LKDYAEVIGRRRKLSAPFQLSGRVEPEDTNAQMLPETATSFTENFTDAEMADTSGRSGICIEVHHYARGAFFRV